MARTPLAQALALLAKEHDAAESLGIDTAELRERRYSPEGAAPPGRRRGRGGRDRPGGAASKRTRRVGARRASRSSAPVSRGSTPR